MTAPERLDLDAIEAAGKESEIVAALLHELRAEREAHERLRQAAQMFVDIFPYYSKPGRDLTRAYKAVCAALAAEVKPCSAE